jgi:hypothetical protein
VRSCIPAVSLWLVGLASRCKITGGPVGGKFVRVVRSTNAANNKTKMAPATTRRSVPAR